MSGLNARDRELAERWATPLLIRLSQLAATEAAKCF